MLCKMAEEFGDRLSEFYEKYKLIIDLNNIVEACNDMVAVRNDIALFLSDSVSIDRNLDEIETK